MKKLLTVIAGIAAFVLVKRKKGQDSKDVWRDATRSS
ncbi:DLW-39 family protein [Jatrophihabitans telluris]|uniref:DLW-39 family protein n=1 Tax=Jatrophihabitans telluris TaxID=2038343 RepID=A0ABY4QYC1_9ACTN|nr:DLW-39 family protein [Jatrophihabitans telluris]UQX88564.1 DLW-39 family protein [Jatrophihabitans telluris]